LATSEVPRKSNPWIFPDATRWNFSFRTAKSVSLRAGTPTRRPFFRSEAHLISSFLPLCDASEKSKVFYAYIDIIGTIFFVLAWLWLRSFEAKESRVLNRSTVSASDYTIRLKSVPEDTTEKELAIHFAETTGEAVSAVHLAFNKSKEIEMYIQRGEVMQQRYKCEGCDD